MHRIYLAFLCFFRILFGKPLPDELLPPMPTPPPLALPQAPQNPLLTQKTLSVAQMSPLPPALAKALGRPPAEPSVPSGPTAKDGALQLLGLLQREGRLVDFLRESIETYDDATVGAAVRDIHRGCKKALDEHFTLEPVMGGAENDRVSVAVGFDAARLRLVGDVKGQPPFSGVLRHHGWAAVKVRLPQPTGTVDYSVVAPAEIEIS